VAKRSSSRVGSHADYEHLDAEFGFWKIGKGPTYLSLLLPSPVSDSGDHMLENNQNTERRLLDALAYYRGLILDSVEQEIGDSPRWKLLRSRLLKYLGERGLEAQIKEITSGNGE